MDHKYILKKLSEANRKYLDSNKTELDYSIFKQDIEYCETLIRILKKLQKLDF